MKKFLQHTGVAAPLIRNNIDTDAIIPSVEMKRVSRHGLSEGMFAGWRYQDRVRREPNPDFVLNRPEYTGASILLAGINFGCGSSREHAVWALAEFGIRAIIAVSFGSIFRNNCVANGLLPICLPTATIEQLANHVQQDPQNNLLCIDLEQCTVSAQDLTTGLTFKFEIADSDADMLRRGLDPIALTLQLQEQIDAFQHDDRKSRPWAYLQR